jgi:site-specific recombinase XerD
MMTQLRQRMLEELQRRNYSSRTIRLYLRHVAEFAQHFHHSPDQLGADDIRRYQLFLIQEKKLAWSSYNQIVCALRFFYVKTLKRAFLLSDISDGSRNSFLSSSVRRRWHEYSPCLRISKVWPG